MKQLRDQLILRFRQQQQFSEEYSPLYAALFGTVAGWLTHQPEDPIVNWLLKAARHREPFDIPNLLVAGLHYEVLSRNDDVSALAAFYPSVEGEASPHLHYAPMEKKSREVSPRFARALYNSILARQSALEKFIQTNTVQTNETGRGLSWLLSSCLAHWKGVHLVDLGASAGLNLIAEQRAFRLDDGEGSSSQLCIGLGKQEQFLVHTIAGPADLFLADCPPPLILSRTGCDLNPFYLETTKDEQKLASFIWADQVERSKRLREGISSFHEVQRSAVPVRLFSVILPEDLPAFLNERRSGIGAPLLIYNTYLKMYLPDKGAELRDMISVWAAKQSRPVVWIQWEPPSTISHLSATPPHFGWLAWMVDIWNKDEHLSFQLGWVHPHGQQVHWLAGLERWISYWN